MSQHWSIYPLDVEANTLLSTELNIHSTTAQILINRGIKTADDAKKFLSPDLNNIPNPFCLPDMEQAVQRIISALKNKETIAIYGDYDVDGITASALIKRYLKQIGRDPIVFIPSRLTHGYGLNKLAIDELKNRNVDLIITVDCGTKSGEEIEYAKKLGMDVIVTDHHEAKDYTPNYILINPKRQDAKTSDKDMSGCGVAFLLMMALRKTMRDEGLLSDIEPNLKEHLDLVALGTIADVVPLLGVNRVFSKFGLEIVQTSNKPGIRSLVDNCGLLNAPINAGHVAFRIAPRINAAGRLGDAYPSLELLTTDDPNEALEIASKLNSLNTTRQKIEDVALKEAIKNIEAGCLHERGAIVVSSADWHVGIIGIVASKLVERYSVPTIVITRENEIGKGSARSVYGLNIVEVLKTCSTYLNRYGGHAQAAGLQLDLSQMEHFSNIFIENCEKHCTTPGAAAHRIAR